MDGIILINKPKGCTSHDIVYKVKKVLNIKVGHTGTLDPMATGVLPLLIGKGTLCSKYLINHDKIYRARIQLGKKTDTADAEGKVIEEGNIPKESLTEKKVNEILKTFLGNQEQIPPIYSAIKVNGKKLYEYARKGQKVEIQPRNIEIYSIELIEIDSKDKQIEFKVSCSKGTYIRSLCENIAEKLGTVGYMCELCRLKVGDFDIKDTITVQELEENKDLHIISIEQLFKDKKTLELDDRKLQLFLNGVQLTNKANDGIYKIYVKQQFIGIGIVKNELLKRDIIISHI